MTKSNNRLIQNSINNCLENVESLLWGSNSDFPSFENIRKANQLIETAQFLDSILHVIPLNETITLSDELNN